MSTGVSGGLSFWVEVHDTRSGAGSDQLGFLDGPVLDLVRDLIGVVSFAGGEGGEEGKS